MGVLTPSALAFLNRWPRRLAVLACLLFAGASALPAPHRSVAHPATDSEIVVAAREIVVGAALVRADLTVAAWPRALVPAGAFTSLVGALGRRTLTPISPGEAVTATRLVGTDLAAGLPATLVAVSLVVADPNASTLIRAGDHVDLLAAASAAGPDGSPPMSPPPSPATVVADHARVLAVLPASSRSEGWDGTGLIIAADRASALRLAGLTGQSILAVRDERPG